MRFGLAAHPVPAESCVVEIDNIGLHWKPTSRRRSFATIQKAIGPGSTDVNEPSYSTAMIVSLKSAISLRAGEKFVAPGSVSARPVARGENHVIVHNEIRESGAFPGRDLHGQQPRLPAKAAFFSASPETRKCAQTLASF